MMVQNVGSSSTTRIADRCVGPESPMVPLALSGELVGSSIERPARVDGEPRARKVPDASSWQETGSENRAGGRSRPRFRRPPRRLQAVSSGDVRTEGMTQVFRGERLGKKGI